MARLDGYWFGNALVLSAEVTKSPEKSVKSTRSRQDTYTVIIITIIPG